jgi:hypothetical protein
MFVDAACFELHIMAGRSDCSAGAGAHVKMLGSRGVRRHRYRGGAMGGRPHVRGDPSINEGPDCS